MISSATQQNGETVFVYDETGKMMFARQKKLGYVKILLYCSSEELDMSKMI